MKHSLNLFLADALISIEKIAVYLRCITRHLRNPASFLTRELFTKAPNNARELCARGAIRCSNH